MTRAAKLIWNVNNWESPDGLTKEYGVLVEFIGGAYRYGLEEFLLSEVFILKNYGYLDCFRRVGRNYQNPEDVILFTLDPNGRILHIGNLFNVSQLQDQDSQTVWNELRDLNFIENSINPAFNRIEQLPMPDFSEGARVFMQNNFGEDINHIPNIQSEPPLGFCVNFKYERINLFEEPIDLTEIDPDINRRWKKLNILYKLENLQSSGLSDYFKDSLKR
jgi:hypothetical protein